MQKYKKNLVDTKVMFFPVKVIFGANNYCGNKQTNKELMTQIYADNYMIKRRFSKS